MEKYPGKAPLATVDDGAAEDTGSGGSVVFE